MFFINKFNFDIKLSKLNNFFLNFYIKNINNTKIIFNKHKIIIKGVNIKNKNLKKKK